MMKHFILLGLAVGLLMPNARAQDKPLTNADVVQLVGLGLGDAVVVAKIKQSRDVDFQLRTPDLAALNKAGVPGAVIAAMLERSTAPQTVAQPGSGDERLVVRLVSGGKELNRPGYSGGSRP